MGASCTRLLKTLQLTVHILSKPYINRKELQILLGRWIFILQFRRPGMSMLQDVWTMISGKMKQKKTSVISCRREIFLLIMLCPLFHSNLGASVSKVVTASDASNTGGACAISKNLTDSGWDFFRAMSVQEKSSGAHPILLVSLFNGIGGCFRCYDIAGIEVQG